MITQRIRHLVSLLPAHPTDADLHSIASELADAAVAKRSPARSIAKAVDHHLTGVPDEARARVRQLARQMVDASRAESPLPTASLPTGERWLTVREAARILDLLEDTLLDRLKDLEYRRLYGWPVYDGRWRFPAPAILPSTAAAYQTTMPRVEPWTPPRWCRR